MQEMKAITPDLPMENHTHTVHKQEGDICSCVYSSVSAVVAV